ncbi:60S ribosomal protein L27a [Thelohanellus kitauei]|uniref:Large ribosomal subunit protein uL15 n=1 Tax=Thelohanellus kitauei TaxID=669202 RepID=A0A0C2MY51_THEKT|nr:60S ribosomal protein L27a [Thelohanellus kitauei]
MTTKLRKNRRLRGHVSAGHGRVGKHRKHDAGRGKAGGLHHHRILFDKYHPGYFGKHGMRQFHYKKNANYCPVINVDQIWSLINKSGVVPDSKNVPLVDCTSAGFHKVLGRGHLPQKPVIVKARFFSKEAEDKIKAAGGSCVLTA